MTQIQFKEQDEVQISFKSLTGWESVWVKVMFKDTDDTFIGRVTRVGRRSEGYKIDSDYRFENEDVKNIYTGQQLCYSDNTSICDCPGLCREK